jgi:iron complex outermembrane receptor protein
LWTAAAAAAIVGVGPSMADQATTSNQTSAESTGLEEIVVTAQFRRQNLQDTPVAITAVTAAMIEERGQTSLHDIGQEAPNVTLVETGGAFGPGMTASIRGIGQGDFDPALSPGVGIYIDDVYYTSLTGSNFALIDLDRVEILRGPQGTLSGANSEGGSIKLYSVRPQGDDTGWVKADYGSRNLVEFSGMADVPLIQDTLFMRVSGVSHTQDGYVTRIDYGCEFPKSGIPANGGYDQGCVAGHEGGKDYHGARVALRWLPSENFEANLTGDVTIDNSQVSAVTLINTNPTAGGAVLGAINSGLPPGTYNNQFVPSNPYVSFANFCAQGLAKNEYCWQPYQYTKSWGTNLTLDWKLADDLAVKSITAYRELNSQWTNDDDASPVGASLGWSEILNHTVTEELRLNGNVGKLIDYTLGGYLLDQVTTYPTHQVLDYVFPGSFEFLGDDPVAERDYAGFANATWHIVEGLDFNGGVRYTNQRKDYTYNRYNPATIGGGDSVFFPPGFSGTVGRYSGAKTDYRANLDYRWNEDIMTYVSVSTGFKGGGTNPRPFIASQIVPFGDETLTAYEFGAKTDWFDHALRLNLAAFYDKYKQIQVTLLSCPEFSGGNAGEPCAAPVNGGNADIYGGEAELSYHYQGLSVDAAYSHQKFEYKTVNPATGISLNDSEPGFQSSKWSVGAQYEIPVGAGTLTPRLDYSFSGGYYTNANNDPNSYLPAFHVLNGRITYKPEGAKWDVAVVGYNMLDKLWYQQLFDLSATEGQVYGIPSMPRTISIEFKKKFGPPPPPPAPVVKEVVREVIKEVQVPAPVPPPPPPPPPAPKADIVLQGVTFATNSAKLLPQSASVLDNAVRQLKQNPNVAIEIRGYTDNRGSAAYNQKLSQQRAESVLQYLQEHGLTNHLTAKGFGKEDPIADNSTNDGRLTNRRVALHIEGGAP